MKHWGARNNVDEFLKDVMKGASVIDVSSVREFFVGKLPVEDIDKIIDHIENDSISELQADITTTVLIVDGDVKKTYRFETCP